MVRITKDELNEFVNTFAQTAADKEKTNRIMNETPMGDTFYIFFNGCKWGITKMVGETFGFEVNPPRPTKK
jgi:hypothetical protein